MTTTISLSRSHYAVTETYQQIQKLRKRIIIIITHKIIKNLSAILKKLNNYILNKVNKKNKK